MGFDFSEYSFCTMMDYYLDNPEYLGCGDRPQYIEEGDNTTREIIIVKEVPTYNESPQRGLINPVIFL